MKFSIRELLLVTVIVALVVGWCLDHRAWAEACSTQAHESQIWEARAAMLQVRVEMLVEQQRAASMAGTSAVAPNQPTP